MRKGRPELVDARSFRIKVILVIGAAAVSLCLVALAALPSAAKADSWTNYCNNQQLTGKQYEVPGPLCYGAHRTLNATMGMGDQHSVCVWHNADWIKMCTTGPGAWVYNPGSYQFAYTRPYISNNAFSPTIVHAVAWTKN
jgi:hypothetical protein